MSHINNGIPFQIVGEWNVICDVCGFKQKSGTMRAGVGRQMGLYVCADSCFDGVQPQDDLRYNYRDMRPLPFARPLPTPIFVPDAPPTPDPYDPGDSPV